MTIDKETLDAIREIVRDELKNYRPTCHVSSKKNKSGSISDLVAWCVVGVIGFIVLMATIRVMYEVCKAGFGG